MPIVYRRDNITGETERPEPGESSEDFYSRTRKENEQKKIQEQAPAQPAPIILQPAGKPYGSVAEQLSRPIAKAGLISAGVLTVALATLITVGTATGMLAAGGLYRSAAPAAIKTFTGKVPINSLMSPTGALRVQQTNQAIAAQTGSLISKMATGLKNPAVVTGIVLGGLSAAAFYKGMTSNERGDTIVQLSIGYRDALKAGDTEGAAQIKEMIDDISNPSFLKKLEMQIPFVNYLGAVVDKIKAAKMVSDVAESRIQGEQAGETGETSASQDWNAIFAAQLERQEAEREADLKQQAKSIKMWADAKQAQRDADAAYWKKQIDEANERARLKAEANEKYWLQVYKMREESQQSNLNFGLL